MLFNMLVGAAEALALSTPFDEYALLIERYERVNFFGLFTAIVNCMISLHSKRYLENELEIKLNIVRADDESVEDPGKKKDNATPGKPSFYPYSME